MTIDHPKTGSGRKPKGGGPERREEILAQALRLFGEFGVQHVSTRQIAAAVGISQPSLYAYFPTKHALVAEVYNHAYSRLTARMQAVADEGSGLEMMARMARVYIDFGLSEPDAYRVAFMMESPEGGPDSLPDTALESGLRAYNVCRDGIRQLYGEGPDEASIDLLAQSHWAMLHGLVSLLIARPTFPWADRERLIELHIAKMAGMSNLPAEA